MQGKSYSHLMDYSLDFRGQGLGSFMVDTLLKQTSPGDRIFLTTIGRAKDFYEGFGFREVPPWDNVPW